MKTPRNFSIRGTGRFGDKGASLSETSPEQTTIQFKGIYSEDLFDFSTEGSPWGMRNITLSELVFIGNTTGYILNNSGSFKCSFKNLTIRNSHTNGNGWKLNNFDQADVSNVFVLGLTSGYSTGIAFDLRNTAEGIDGSLSTFRKLLAQGYGVGFQCGYERDLGIDGHFQSYNTFSSVSANDCGIAMILGDRWVGNTFINSQLRGETYGIRMGSRADSNQFINGVVQCNDTLNAVTSLYLGYGNIAANKQSKNNRFIGVVFQTNKQTAPPVIWNNDASAAFVQDNVFEDCTFESLAFTHATNGIEFTSSGNSHIISGSIIRPKFIRINVPYSYQGNTLNIINPEQFRTLHRFITTTSNVPTILGSIRPVTNGVMSIDAHVVAKDTIGNKHASYKIQALVYNNGTDAVLVGSPVITGIETDISMDCTIDVLGVEVRFVVTGIADNEIIWHTVVNIITI